MRRISSHIQLIAVLVALCFAGQTIATVAAWGAAAATNISPAEKASLDKQLQEAIAKGKLGQSAGAQGATGTESTGSGLGAGSGGGLGSSEAFSSLTHKAEEAEEEPVSEAASTSTSSTGISSGVLVPIFVVGGALLAGIAFLIVRDARSVAPAGDGLGGSGSSQDRATRMRKRRAKAKAARRQRKRNR
jgi:hypothetical protein